MPQAEVTGGDCMESEVGHENLDWQVGVPVDLRRSGIPFAGRFFGRGAEVLRPRTWHRCRLYECIQHGSTHGLEVYAGDDTTGRQLQSQTTSTARLLRCADKGWRQDYGDEPDRRKDHYQQIGVWE